VSRIAEVDRVEIVEVWATGLCQREEVYRDADTRGQGAAPTHPELVPLAEVIERLGRLAGHVTPTSTPPAREPVPKWLYERSIQTGQFRREEVAAMTAEVAFEAWNDHISRGRG
jgi:hypothetical protein